MARLLQPPITLTLHRPLPATPPRVIELLHPDYAPGENILLVLRALDDGGLDYDTAVIAAGIVAGNIWTVSSLPATLTVFSYQLHALPMASSEGATRISSSSPTLMC